MSTIFADNLSPEGLQNLAQSALQTADSLFDQFQALHLSLTALLVGALFAVLILIFALREAASWFFKVDSVRRDLRQLKQMTSQLEQEVKHVQDLMSQLNGPLRDCLNERLRETQSSSQAEDLAQDRAQDQAQAPVPPSAQKSAPGMRLPVTTETASENASLAPADSSPASKPDEKLRVAAPVGSDSRQFPIVH